MELASFQATSHFLKGIDKNKVAYALHLQSFLPTSPAKASVFFMHGAIEDGRIFYSRSGKGLAPFLAQAGYAVYILDLRGRGKSIPTIQRHCDHGQQESIHEDIPAALRFIQKNQPQQPIICGAHSWGGVLMMAALAHQPKLLESIKGLVFFGSKRRVMAPTWQKRVHIDFFWNHLAFAFSRFFGYLPAAKLRIGSDSETRRSHRESVQWVKSDAWQSSNGFDYAKELQSLPLPLPPQLHLAGPHDYALGHPTDVLRFKKELGGKHSSYKLLSRQHGFKHNYGHIDMLTHPDGPADHFPMILNWMNKQIEA